MNFSEIAEYVDQRSKVALIHADVLVGMGRLPDCSIDMVVTSPPYWTAVEYEQNDHLSSQTYEDYIAWLGSVWLECFRVLRPNGKMIINTPVMPIPKRVINQSPRHLKNIFVDIENWLLFHSDFLRYGLFVWQKQTSKMMFGSYPFPPNIIENNTVEFMPVYVKPGEPKKVSKATKEANRLRQYEWLDLTQQVWFMYPADVKRELSHPAPFPPKLPARFMKMYTFGESPDYEGDIILDPFNGAGTTTSVAKMLKRRAIGIELSEKYYKIAQDRLAIVRWGQDTNWLVGRPSYMNSEELAEYRALKETEPDTELSDDDRSKGEEKHKKATYGRGVDKKTSKVEQKDLFSSSERKE